MDEEEFIGFFLRMLEEMAGDGFEVTQIMGGEEGIEQLERMKEYSNKQRDAEVRSLLNTPMIEPEIEVKLDTERAWMDDCWYKRN